MIFLRRDQFFGPLAIFAGNVLVHEDPEYILKLKLLYLYLLNENIPKSKPKP